MCNVCGTPLVDHDIYKKQINEQNTITEFRSPVYIPRCPTCGSIDIEKISEASKVGKVVLFGLFAAESISKTFHCKNCGYRW